MIRRPGRTRRPPRQWLRFLVGLRARLLIAFVLVTVLGAGAAAWASAGSAGRALVASAQQRHSQDVAARITAIAPQLNYPPSQVALSRLRNAVGPNTLVTYENRASEDGTVAPLITSELRAAVQARGRLLTQRVRAEGRPWLLIGTPVLITATDGRAKPSGIEVYSVRDLSDVNEQIATLTRSAAITSALTLPAAALLALLAAGSVLRPVRDLRDTARRLAVGDLSARTSPRGADELADLTTTLNDMAAALQTSMTAMQQMQTDARRFAADVSHELRTPLSTLTAVTSVLQAAVDDLGPEERESAQLAISETQRLVTLVEDLMEVSRFDAGTAQLRTEEVELGAAVRSSLRARGWLDRVEVLAPEGVSARVDPRRLDVIVANLVANALRHGGGTVQIRLGTGGASGDQVMIEVIDAGPGLPEAVLPHVFERFYKADTARTRSLELPGSPGSGLGLALALENARLHTGTLTAGNNPNGPGACFRLTLPRDPENS